MAEPPDLVDVRMCGWVAEIPGIDLEVEGIVERINHLNKRIWRMLETTLSEFDLNVGEWRMLGELRSAGEPFHRSPGALAKRFDLTTGAITNRLDGLEEAGFVRRLPDPSDRRGVIVELTPKGRKIWERAVGAQGQKEQFVTSGLTKAEQKQLNSLLRRMMHAAESPTIG